MVAVAFRLVLLATVPPLVPVPVTAELIVQLLKAVPVSPVASVVIIELRLFSTGIFNKKPVPVLFMVRV